MTVRLLGGWGYFNLGDEALLAGYLETLRGQFELEVGSVAPERTRFAQRGEIEVRKEGAMGAFDGTVILGGGGYLNGSWLPEIGRKIRRISRDAAHARVITHSIEARGLAGTPFARPIASLLKEASTSVRDAESAEELVSLTLERPQVVPDAIALLVPYLDAYRRTIPELRGKVLLNLLDISRRPDSAESEFPAMDSVALGAELVRILGDRAVGLVIGEGDAEYLRSLGPIQILAPKTVSALVSILGSVAGVYSVRMHPALIASALGTPTVSVPYCGKVRPTLTRVGAESVILKDTSADAAMGQLSSSTDLSASWVRASSEATAVLNSLLGASATGAPVPDGAPGGD